MKKNLTISSLLIALLFMLTSAYTASAVTIKPNINLDHPVIMADRTETIYVQVDFDVPADYIDVRRHRPDLNIGLVIDRSGSMADRGKMNYAKDAANFVIDQLNPSDRIAIVEYDDRVTLLARSQNVTSKWRLKSKINELYPRGATNLTGGMMRGIDELIEYYSSRDINRILLLSDGLANRGITSMRDIKRLVKQARRDGITISTIGLGLDYNEDLMQMIAEYGGGTYYYIESPRQMRDIFEAEMGQIFATVAKDVKARLKRSRHVRDFEIYGYVNDDGRDVASIGNLYAGEKISLTCKLEVSPSEAGEINLGDFEFDYYDVKTNKTITFKKPLSVKVTKNVQAKEQAENKDVRAEALVVEADAFHEKQVRLVEQGRADEAKKNITKYQAGMAAAAPSLNNALL
ncbi:MAG: VWA domain-containing protein, partial [Calditrichaeota bacterium]